MANKVTVTDDEDEAESAHWYVCSRAAVPSHFEDDLYDFCSQCGEKVRYRPYGPVAPKKICMECAVPDIVKSAENGELESVISKKTAEEVKKFFKRQ